MDKNAIKTFAVESRRKMIKSVKFQASLLGITADEIKEPISKAEGMETYDYGAGQHTIYDEDIKKRESLVREINNKGFENVVEEVAYTWFNRIIAIRYMEVNDYLPTYTRVLSSEIEGKIEPDIITEALDLDLDYSDDDREKILKFKMDNDNDKLFQFLFIKQCNKLNEILPGLFEKTDDYMELLLDIKFTDDDSVVRQLVDTISEEDFGDQVEIIGWLYQFYNIELKDDTFKNIKKEKVPKERIPAATQLFTPNWIVKYMVENSVGRLWLEGHPNEELKLSWKYFIEEANQEPEVELKLAEIRKKSAELKPENIKVIDPCMGSGHILVYVFDILMQIYITEGYTKKDAAENILKYNLYGLDIDDRAFQLAYFAVLMKACKYNKQILRKNIVPLLYSIKESNNIPKDFMNYLFTKIPEIKDDLNYLLSSFKDAKEFGSILKIRKIDFDNLFENLDCLRHDKSDLYVYNHQKNLQILTNIISQAKFLSDDFEIVITNPPYMNLSGMNKNLKNFIKKNYSDSKGDLFAVFIERCLDLLKENGILSMITQQSFMFLSTFEKLRIKLLTNNTFLSMAHLGPRAFDEIGGEVVQATTFVLRRNYINNYNSTFHRLTDYNSEKTKEREFFNENNVYIKKQIKFKNIPGMPIAYWIGDDFINIFNYPTIGDYSEVITGMTTGNNDSYLRFWYEVNSNNISFNKKDMKEIDIKQNYWIPYNKGGKRRNWFGNNEYVVKWSEKENFNRAKTTLERLYLREGLTWSFISSGKFSMRYFSNGFLWDVSGSPAFFDDTNIMFYTLGFLCTNFATIILNFLNPTISIQAADLKKIPLIYDENKSQTVNKLVKDNIRISCRDWDEKETSWNFRYHTSVDSNNKKLSLKESFYTYKQNKKNDFFNLKSNEIKLNEIFSEIYSVEFDTNIPNKDITMDCQNLDNFIKSFISYAVGCMFGRYSLDEEGLQFAGGEFNINNYSKFIPDDDNIIPVLDTEYFNDDIVGRFVEFVKVCFGEETLEENLDFIAGALNKKGKTSREIIRNYFLTDFFKDHAQTYKKCPIYWQFDSGKQNAFKCLIYMHRYEPGLVARVRTDYLHKTQKAIEQNLANCESIIANSSNKSEVSKATKDKSKYIKQLDEIKVYDEALAHIANQRIEIDLDDGVKVNHAKFQNVEISKEGQKAKKINLLKKI